MSADIVREWRSPDREVHDAALVISAQLDVDIDEAARWLGAHSDVSRTALYEVAVQVLERRLFLGPSPHRH